MNPRGSFGLYLVTGLALGIGIGLLIAWGLAPVQYVDTTPATLRLDFKDEYRALIAAAYTASGDLPRAQARLSLLEDADPLKALGDQTQRMLANNVPMEQIRILADLSEALQSQPTLTAVSMAPQSASPTPALPLNEASATPEPVLPAPSAESATPEPGPILLPTETETPAPLPTAIFTATQRATRTPTPTPGAPYELVNQTTFCEPTQPGLLQVFLINAANQPAAGIELVITWFGGEEHFFTGLKSDMGYGYADYKMTENVEYALSLSAGGTRVTGLRTSACTDTGGNAYPGGIRLDFKQP